jgi:hypothetical protein
MAIDFRALLLTAFCTSLILVPLHSMGRGSNKIKMARQP